MKVRTFVSFLWMFVMAVFAGFGSYYVITGQNILTGQSRLEKNSAVLNAVDVVDDTEINNNSAPVELSENEKELQKFSEIYNKTTTEVSMPATQGGEATVLFRYGVVESKLYTTILSSGLPKDQVFNAWLIGENDKVLNLGLLKMLDDSDVHRLSFESEENLEEYDIVSVTLDDTLEEGKEYTFIEDFVVYSGEIKLQAPTPTITPSVTP